jgi:hypothetical protein
MKSAGVPDALAAANSHYDTVMTTKQTVEAANDVARTRSLDAPIRALASSIVGTLKDARKEIPYRVAVWIRENVKYTQETPYVEVLQGPYRTLGKNVTINTPMGPYQFNGTGTGDCDDLSILFACLCRSIGIEAFVAGIAKRSTPDNYFHAMGYCNGLFYELSKDGPYGGVGGNTIASASPYPNIICCIYDPDRHTYKTVDPLKSESGMSGSNGTNGGCGCSSCNDGGNTMSGTDCNCGCENCSDTKSDGRGPVTSVMGIGEGIGAPLRPTSSAPSDLTPAYTTPLSPIKLEPFDSLQPRHTVPFNLYAPTRQISGISMNGSLGTRDDARLTTPLMTRTENMHHHSNMTPHFDMGTTINPPGVVGGAVDPSSIFEPFVSTEQPEPSADTPEKPSSNGKVIGFAAAALVAYFIMRKK